MERVRFFFYWWNSYLLTILARWGDEHNSWIDAADMNSVEVDEDEDETDQEEEASEKPWTAEV
jgi:hypothetical protein